MSKKYFGKRLVTFAKYWHYPFYMSKFHSEKKYSKMKKYTDVDKREKIRKKYALFIRNQILVNND